jgi:hypothetical protein
LKGAANALTHVGTNQDLKLNMRSLLWIGMFFALSACAGPSPIQSAPAPLVWRHNGPGAADDETLQAALAFCNDTATKTLGSFNLFPEVAWEMNRNGCMMKRGWALQRPVF